LQHAAAIFKTLFYAGHLLTPLFVSRLTRVTTKTLGSYRYEFESQKRDIP